MKHKCHTEKFLCAIVEEDMKKVVILYVIW